MRRTIGIWRASLRLAAPVPSNVDGPLNAGTVRGRLRLSRGGGEVH